ncbi:MAG: 4-hydroxy-3-methylbut-2-enyl diphosphate reductase [Atopobiaceae bacterium]|nr:4-hydroxy-3-methylbut-2-enyl diphosphate reductase [Atopobiaceae bacterium]
MAEVIVASEAGACFGVERALDLVRTTAREACGPVHTLGPLIHNPIVVDELAALGVTAVNDPSEVGEGSTLVLRTHGVAPSVERAAVDAGATVVDATCPFVKRAHRAAERLAGEGYQLLILGEEGHPEVEGIVGHAPEAIVVSGAADLAGIELRRRVGVVVQTTQSKANLRSLVSELVGRVDELRVLDTICEATAGHQGACAELAKTVDVMVVVGGKNSANTTRLAEIAAAICPHTHHVETPQELCSDWFANAERIGITAGASTPAAHIEAIKDAICGMARG